MALRFQSTARRVVDHLIGEETERLMQDAAFIARSADPFLVENDCLNPAGHEVMASCGAIVCRHCSKVFWQ
jgi:hypothetical protein